MKCGNDILRAILFFSFIVLMFFSFSCNDKEKEDLNEEEKVLYDSLKNLAFHDIRSRTDTICSKISDSLFHVYVDSLMILRKNEIDALFNEN
jgi:hypothetical protein